jgi:hypothetical protein
MTDLTPWLPAEALNPAHFERGVGTVVSDWSSHWFVKAKASCRTQLRSIAGGPSPQLAWRSWGQECGVAIDEAGRNALAEAMLDCTIAANAMLASDQPLLNDITDRCLDDLLGRLSWLIDHDRSPDVSDQVMDPGPAIVWDIGLKRSGVILSLAVNWSALVRWRKRLAPPQQVPRPAGIGRALQSQSVRLGLDLGRGSLTLAELESLEPGDVIILDAKIDAPAPILAAGRITKIRGKLRQEAEGVSIDIIE